MMFLSIAHLKLFVIVQNEFNPLDWLPVLQVVVDRIKIDKSEEETSIMFELLKTLVEAGADVVASHIPHIIYLLTQHIVKHIPLVPEPWPQVSLAIHRIEFHSHV